MVRVRVRFRPNLPQFDGSSPDVIKLISARKST